MAKHLHISKIFDADQVKEINQTIKTIEEARWITRSVLPYDRGLQGAACNYDFCGHSQMSKDVKEYLKSVAPKHNFELQEIAINRYNVGDYIGKHRDNDRHFLNLVIALQENGDGLYIDDEDRFIEDVAGQGVLMTGVGPTHSVPPAKSLRHTLIYLYG
jgi:hypothetical protein